MSMKCAATADPSTRPTGPLFHAGLGLLALVWVLPVLFLVLAAVRTQGDLIEHGVFSIPRALRFANFTSAWETANLGPLFRSSLWVALVKVPIGLTLSSLAAYALAKTRLRFGRPILMLFLVGLGVPIYVTLMPLSLLVRSLGLSDTPWGLVVAYSAFGLPFQIMVLTSFFRSVPTSLVEAARIDGCSEAGVFFRIMLPVARPALATLFIIDAVGTWNEFLLALVMLTSDAWRTVPLGMLHFQGQFMVRYTELAAAILMSIAPVLLVYALFQRHLVSGITSGAVKE
jgi:raffinose/stachyose/melibiose transport system permease protein